MMESSQLRLYDTSQEFLKGFGSLGFETVNPDYAPSLFAVFISSTIGLITLIAIIWFIVNLITGAISILTSGGDKNSLENAKKKITTSLIGLLVTVFALLVVNFIGWLIGLPGILGFQEMFKKLIIN